MMRKVLVTGANGHIGLHVTAALLAQGASVRCGVRATDDERLRRLPVEIVPLDVTAARQVDAATAGMDGVIHLATPYRRFAPDPRRDILQPAVAGTEHVVRACRAAGVRKLVVTSSVAAVGFSTDGAPRDERHWNERALNPYTRAKCAAEERAWALAAELDVPLVTLCPATVIGPGFARHTPSTMLLQRLLDGNVPAVPPITLSYVDARDVAQAHVAALLGPATGQRYVLAAQGLTLWELVQRLRALEPGLKLPRVEMGSMLFALMPLLDWLSHHVARTPRELDLATYRELRTGMQLFDSGKAARELGWSPRALAATLADTLDWIRRAAPARA